MNHKARVKTIKTAIRIKEAMETHNGGSPRTSGCSTEGFTGG